MGRADTCDTIREAYEKGRIDNRIEKRIWKKSND